jgi:hypothetical protein
MCPAQPIRNPIRDNMTCTPGLAKIEQVVDEAMGRFIYGSCA